MTILSSDILKFGPCIKFADYSNRHREAWSVGVDPNYFNDQVFFEMSETLLGVFCKATNGGSPIDPYDCVELRTESEIRKLAADFLIWTFDLVRASPDYFRKEVEDYGFYKDTLRPRYNSDLTGEDLRLDLIDTLLMLVGRLAKIARNNGCLVIRGI